MDEYEEVSLEELELEKQVVCPECGTENDAGEACPICGHRPEV